MVKKRPSLSDRMAELFNGPQKSVPTELVPERPSGRVPGGYVMDVSSGPMPGGKNLYTELGRQEQERNRPEPRTYPGYEVKLSNGQSVFWNEHTPKAAIEKGLLTDEKLNHWASQWTEPGGNRFAEMLYADRLFNVYGFWENQNLHPSGPKYVPWSDRSHYFDWAKWKVQYNALKG